MPRKKTTQAKRKRWKNRPRDWEVRPPEQHGAEFDPTPEEIEETKKQIRAERAAKNERALELSRLITAIEDENIAACKKPLKVLARREAERIMAERESKRQ